MKNTSSVGVVIVLLVIIGVEFALRDGLSPFRTLGQAAAGELELR